MSYYIESKFPNVDRHEFLQAQQKNMPVAIESYKDALWWWNQRQNWRGTNDRPVASIEDGRRRMRMNPDKSISFEYNGHVLATWRTDNSIDVEPYSGYLYGPFDRFVMPRSIEVTRTRQLGSLIYLKLSGEDQVRVNLETETGKKCITNPDIWVIRASEPINLSFDKDEGRWMPTNEYRCKPFEWFELDKSGLHEAAAKYNIPTFLRAIETAMQMGAEIKTADGGYRRSYNPTTNLTSSGEDILTLLEEERFVEAASLVRANVERTWDASTGKYNEETLGLKATDVKRIRGLAYAEMGLLYIETDRIVDLRRLTTIENKLREYGDPAA
jgi:hypothetical protein